jgi:hypothetical protein
MIQQYHSLGYTQRNVSQGTTKTPKRYSQQPTYVTDNSEYCMYKTTYWARSIINIKYVRSNVYFNLPFNEDYLTLGTTKLIWESSTIHGLRKFLISKGKIRNDE